MFDVVERCLPERIGGWRPTPQAAIPSYGRRLADDPALLVEDRAEVMQTLDLTR
jgi:malate dehydrogenase (quinone)